MPIGKRVILSFTVLLLAVAGLGAAGAPGSTPVLFVLDASGSMWGRIDGTEKIAVAKGTLIQLISGLGDDVQIGLIAYGHRREGDCGDIELLAPVASGQRDDLAAHVQALNPKGKTPITRSLQLAAEEVRKVAGEVVVVLLSDGIENCDADPCETVASLVASGVRMQLFVVGFGVADDEAAQLECLAKAGNGVYSSADSAADLLNALVTVAERLETPQQDREGTLLVTASGESQYTVLDATGENRVDSARTNTAVKLAPGYYRVELGRSSQLVQVRAGEETRLGAGAVVVTGLGKGMYSVFDVTGEHKVDFTRTNRPIDVLEGSYLVELEGTRRVATVTAGETTTMAAASIVVTGASGSLFGVYDPTGVHKYQFTRVGRPIEVLAGFYSVKVGDRWIKDIELKDGQHLEIPER